MKVTDVKLDTVLCSGVPNFEEEPGIMPSRIGIDPHKQVILLLGDFNDQIKIATLEIGIEDKPFLLDGRIHPNKQSIIGNLVVEFFLTLSDIREVELLELREAIEEGFFAVRVVLFAAVGFGEFKVRVVPGAHVDHSEVPAGSQLRVLFREQVDRPVQISEWNLPVYFATWTPPKRDLRPVTR